jgi:putative transposase
MARIISFKLRYGLVILGNLRRRLIRVSVICASSKPALEGERGGRAMKRKQFTAEKIIGLPQQAEVELAQGKRVGEVCRGLGISEQSYYRWRTEYGGLKLEQARRMKDLEKENGRLKKAVAELTQDKQILKEALEPLPSPKTAKLAR